MKIVILYYNFLFSEVVEPKIGQEAPVAVYHFPSSQAALAQLSPEDSRVAERFEFYYKGLELANGFHELLMRVNSNTALSKITAYAKKQVCHNVKLIIVYWRHYKQESPIHQAWL